MKDDAELLRDYVKEHSESAFAELVKRHVDLVYSSALRQLNGNSHQAQDVTQTVFTDLALKAKQLQKHTSLSGWLYTSVRYAASNIRRSDLRRQEREQEALVMQGLNNTSEDKIWAEIEPYLDDAMQSLREIDRHAVLLRYFQKKSFAEVGHDLGLNEIAARKRVERSVDKLRHYLIHHGVGVSTGALVTLLCAKAVSAAPISLAATLTATSVAAVTMTGTHSTILISSLMAITKTQIAAVVITGALTTALFIQHNTNVHLHTENSALAEQVKQIPDLQNKLLELSNSLANTRKSLPEDKLNELLRLRNQVGMLEQKLAKADITLKQSAKKLEQTPAAPEQEEQETLQVKKMNFPRFMFLALLRYTQENKEKPIPSTLDELYQRGYAKTDETPLDMANDFEIAYQGAMTSIKNPTETILIREKEAWQGPNGNWLKSYGFADGHTELHSFNSQDMISDWENERTQKN